MKCERITILHSMLLGFEIKMAPPENLRFWDIKRSFAVSFNYDEAPPPHLLTVVQINNQREFLYDQRLLLVRKRISQFAIKSWLVWGGGSKNLSTNPIRMVSHFEDTVLK